MKRDQIHAGIILAINRGLLGEVNPSLRGVAFEWDAIREKITVFFYHDGEINDEIEDHYSCIDFEASVYFTIDKDPIKLIENDFQVVVTKFPDPLPAHKHWVYKRKEPFVDPK